MKKKIIIVLIIFILGVAFVSYGLVNYRNTMKNNKEEEVNDNTSSQEKSDYTNNEDSNEEQVKCTSITNYTNKKDYNKELCVVDFITNKEEDVVSLKFNIINNTDNIIKNKQLKINFYNENELFDTFEYTIEELEQYDEIGIETEVIVEKLVTKYEFEIDNFKTNIKPNTK